MESEESNSSSGLGFYALSRSDLAQHPLAVQQQQQQQEQTQQQQERQQRHINRVHEEEEDAKEDVEHDTEHELSSVTPPLPLRPAGAHDHALHDAFAAADSTAAASSSRVHNGTSAVHNNNSGAIEDEPDPELLERLESPVLSERSCSSRPSSSASGPSARRLRTALLQAQTRARVQEEGLAFVFAHVDARVRAAVKEVTKAKRAVRRLRKQELAAAAANATAATAASTTSSSSVPSDRSAVIDSDEQTPRQHALPSVSSPYRDAYLSALSSPHLASSSSTVALQQQQPPLPHPSPKIGLAAMPVLALGASASLVSSSTDGAIGAAAMASSSSSSVASSSRRFEEMVDGSYCLLPFESSATAAPSSDLSSSRRLSSIARTPAIRRSVSSSLPTSRAATQLNSAPPTLHDDEAANTFPGSAMHHSSSHQAMLEAHAALQELHHSSSVSQPSSPSAPSSLQTSPLAPVEGSDGAQQSSLVQFPSSSLPALLHAAHSPLNSSSSASGGSFNFASTGGSGGSGAGGHHHILATSPYHIAPSTSLPPLRKMSLTGTRTSSTGSPQLQPMQPNSPARQMMHSPAQAHALAQQQQQQPSVSSAGLGNVPSATGGASSVSQSSSCGSSSSTSTSSASAPPARSPAMEAALQNLRMAQARFSTLAQFCAPLVLRSPSFLRLQEEETLRRLGVLPRIEGGRNNGSGGGRRARGAGGGGVGVRSSSSILLNEEEELSSSAELQLEAIAAQQVLDGSGSDLATLRRIRSGDSSIANAAAASSSASPVDSDINASKLQDDASSLVIVSSPGEATAPGGGGAGSETLSGTDSSPTGSRRGSSSSVLHMGSSSSGGTVVSKAQERDAMKIYIKKLTADLATEGSLASDEAGDNGSASSAAMLLNDSEERKEGTSCRIGVVDASVSTMSSTDITLEEALESCVLLHRHLTSERARLAALEHGEHGVAALKRRVASLSTQEHALQSQLDALRSVHSETTLKARNMEQLLSLLQVPITDKGELPPGFEIHSQSSSLWTLASLTLVFGGLWLVSSGSWRRIWLAVRSGIDSVPRLLTRMGIATGAAVAAGSCAGAAAADSAVAAGVGAGVAAAAPVAAAAASGVAAGAPGVASATHEAATQTARAAMESAASQTSNAGAASSAAQRVMWSHHVHRGLDGAPYRHSLNVTRLPLVRDFLSNLSLQLVQIA